MAKGSFKKKAYTSPGSLIYVGEDTDVEVQIRQIAYDTTQIEETVINDPGKIKLKKDKTNWIIIEGLQDVGLIKSIGEKFDIHPMILEDILNTQQYPKLEIFDDNHIFLTIKILEFDHDLCKLASRHLSLVLGDNYLLSFGEAQGPDFINMLRERLENGNKIRKFKADYLFYILADMVVDSYGILLEKLTERMESLEISILENDRKEDQHFLYKFKREFISVRKFITPLREISSKLLRSESELLNEETDIYFRDLYDHYVQVLAAVESIRELTENIQNIYLNNLNNRMNSVMKTLTVFTAIFMPLSFIAGIYGMNFVNMPELHNPNGYFLTLIIMFVLGLVMWFYFKWKKFV